MLTMAVYQRRDELKRRRIFMLLKNKADGFNSAIASGSQAVQLFFP